MWLDELKENIIELKRAWDLGVIPEPENYTDLVPAQVTMSSLIFAVQHLDRLIAIVEMAEWGRVYRGNEDGVDRYTRGCNICGARHSGEHSDECPYSETWEKE